MTSNRKLRFLEREKNLFYAVNAIKDVILSLINKIPNQNEISNQKFIKILLKIFNELEVPTNDLKSSISNLTEWDYVTYQNFYYKVLDLNNLLKEDYMLQEIGDQYFFRNLSLNALDEYELLRKLLNALKELLEIVVIEDDTEDDIE